MKTLKQHIVTAVHKAASPVIRKLLPNMAFRPYGMHPVAYALFTQTGLSHRRIGQTIGHAAASAGTHVKTGEYEGHDYSPCFDLRVHDLTHAEAIKQIVRPMSALGFAAYMRVPGSDHWPSSEIFHVHCIFPGCHVTEQVNHQLEDWLSEPLLNGLASHVPYRAYETTHDERLEAQKLYRSHEVLSH